MSWSALSINAPMSNARNSTALLTMHSVTPWINGQGQGIYARLSFPNAAAALAERVDSNTPSLAIAITAASFVEFSNQCNSLITAFPLPILQQWQRRATELAELGKTKLNLIDPESNKGGSAINAMPAVKAVHIADLDKQAWDNAESFKSTNPLTNLNTFVTEKTAHDTTVGNAQANAKATLTGGAGWRFYAENDITNALKTGTPGNDKTITAIVLFAGSTADLALLKEIIK